VLLQRGDLTVQEMFTAFFAVVICAVGVGQAVQLAPDLTKASLAKNGLFHLFSQRPAIDAASQQGSRVSFTQGAVLFDRVSFAYPARPMSLVLRDLTLELPGGKSVAIVGASGSGKSTIAGLLLRFYDVGSGGVFIDGVPISAMNVASLRAQIAIVGQEPRLFDATVADNIRYGNVNATDEEVEEAARVANIHETIVSELPDGYQTMVGPKGSLLSGGQRQRLAIARAVVRRPKILILDEATAALDTENEQLVQTALDNLLRERSRTTLIIAHRLSTIRNADKIVLLDDGHVAEQGTHAELMALGGAYAHMVSASS